MAKLQLLFFVTLWLHTSSGFDTSDQSIAKVLSHIVEELGELRKQNTAMKSEINELKAREKHLTGQIDDLRRQVEHAENLDKASEVDTQVKETEADFDVENGAEGVHRQETNGAKESHTRIRQLPQEMPVAFFATLTNHATHLGVHQPIAFDHTITNAGNAYHNSTGVFTAPVSGIYVFSATVFGQSETAYFYFVVNGQFKATLYTNAANLYETTSMTVLLNLKQGDDVFIQNANADKMVHGGHHSSFSGFLLSQNSIEMTSQVIG